MTNQAWVPAVGDEVIVSYAGDEVTGCIVAIHDDQPIAAFIPKGYTHYQYEPACRTDIRPLPTDEEKAVDKCFQCHGEGKTEWHSGYTTQSVTCPLCLGTGVSVDYFIEQVTAKIEAKYSKQPEPDMGDPKNWRVGDIIKCIRNAQGLTYGYTYKVFGISAIGDPIICDDLGGYESRHSSLFELIHQA